MATKIWAAVMAVFAITYVALLGQKGVLLLAEPDFLAKLMGLAMLVLPVFALWAIWKEIDFGIKAERLAKAIEIANLDLELRASGRATKESATKALEAISAQLSIEPSSWQLQFRLGEALDAAGDRKAARAAIRKAIALAKDSKTL